VVVVMSIKRFIEPVQPPTDAAPAPAPVPSDAGPRLVSDSPPPAALREATREAPIEVARDNGRERLPRQTEPPEQLERNPGVPLDLDVVRAIRVNRSAVERRAATIATRRTVKKEWQAAWLLRAITLMDLTTLSGDDTPGTVRRLCA
jgi:hypothetical protein